MLILCIETATTVCSVALTKDGKLVQLKELNEANVHASLLGVYIKEILDENGIEVKDLSAIAVSKGPGSYTGLRIGVSTAKGLCFSHDKPLIAVNTLEAMAKGASQKHSDKNLLLVPMIDARRMEVYTAIYSPEGELIKETSADIIDEHSFKELLKNKKLLFFGDGAEKCKDVLQHPNATFDLEIRPSAAYMTELSYQYFQQNKFEDVAYFEPFYLKDFLAGPKKSVK